MEDWEEPDEIEEPEEDDDDHYHRPLFRTPLVREPNPEGDKLWEKAWDDHRKERAEERERKDAPPVEDEDNASVTILIPGHEVTEGFPRAVNTWRTRLLKNGWLVRVGYAQARHADVYYADARKGIKKPSWVEDQWWVNAAKVGVYVTISYTVIDGTTKRSSRMVTEHGEARLLGDADMKAVVDA